MPLVSRASTVVVLQFGFPKPYLRDSVSLLARRALVATLRRLPCNRSSHRSACAAARPSGRSALRDQSHGSTSLSAPGYAREERDQRRAGLPTGVRLAQLTSPRVRSPTGTARQVGRSATPPPHQRSARASGRPSRQPPSRRTFGSPPARGRACARATGAPGRSVGPATTAPALGAPASGGARDAIHLLGVPSGRPRPVAALARAPPEPQVGRPAEPPPHLRSTPASGGVRRGTTATRRAIAPPHGPQPRSRARQRRPSGPRVSPQAASHTRPPATRGGAVPPTALFSLWVTPRSAAAAPGSGSSLPQTLIPPCGPARSRAGHGEGRFRVIAFAGAPPASIRVRQHSRGRADQAQPAGRLTLRAPRAGT